MRFQRRYVLLTAAVALFFLARSDWNSSHAQAPGQTHPTSREDVSRERFRDDLNKPRRHFRVRRARRLDDDAAREVYGDLKARMATGYAVSGDATVRKYQSWKQYNTAPYGSSTHGNRYVNNFANAKASRYGLYDSAGVLPVGAIIAKDSFVVDHGGKVEPGPLFVMEKMPGGFNYVSGDWRYTMILPDGSLFGTTNGDNDVRVEFCISCHLARESFDHLFFLPKEWRRP